MALLFTQLSWCGGEGEVAYILIVLRPSFDLLLTFALDGSVCFRLFGAVGSCMACGQNIPANEMVMRAQSHVYHVKCFTCVTCRSPLVPGDRFGLVNGSLVCEQDYPKVVKGHTALPARTTHKVRTSDELHLTNGLTIAIGVCSNLG